MTKFSGLFVRLHKILIFASICSTTKGNKPNTQTFLHISSFSQVRQKRHAARQRHSLSQTSAGFHSFHSDPSTVKPSARVRAHGRAKDSKPVSSVTSVWTARSRFSHVRCSRWQIVSVGPENQMYSDSIQAPWRTQGNNSADEDRQPDMKLIPRLLPVKEVRKGGKRNV